MRKVLGVIFVCLSLNMIAQIRVQDALLTMPDTLCPYLTVAQRGYLLQLSKTNERDTVINNFGGKSTLVDITNNTLQLHIAEGITYTLLTANDTITFIQTACAPICSSIVQQYTSDWKYIQTITPSIKGVFVEAIVEDGVIRYADNTPDLLDEDEKREYTTPTN